MFIPKIYFVLVLKIALYRNDAFSNSIYFFRLFSFMAKLQQFMKK